MYSTRGVSVFEQLGVEHCDGSLALTGELHGE